MSSSNKISNTLFNPIEPSCEVIEEACNGVFCSELSREDDINALLDSASENSKLDAMRKIITSIAMGKNASAFFPAVVKNVASKNVEVKKLVYIYLERYAEEQQELALLSISTFQRALKEPNQLIRAAALRILSNIRVSVIAPIVLLAIQTAATDMSPFVRKTSALAIPKLYSVDPTQKQNLVLTIQQLLIDETVLVIGAAVVAFTKVCPERVDLIHSVYKKLCIILLDVDEWDQVIIVNLLTKYARVRFVDPNINKESGEPYLHGDHRFLLDCVKPLLSSNSAAVVTAAAQLFYHTAPKNEIFIIAKPLVRLTKSKTDIQRIVLNTIASMVTEDSRLFLPYLKSFFIFTTETTTVKILKLDILINLATSSNVLLILQELQTYMKSKDDAFVLSTIQAIGTCSNKIPETTSSCLKCLIKLLSNNNEKIVAESVVVIKRLLQTENVFPEDVLKHMIRLLDNVTIGQARAAILWLLSEYSKDLSKVGLKVVAKLAKKFSDEEDIVKLQILNLTVKLHILLPEETEKLCHYIFTVAKYDESYDIRDRARFLKQFVSGSNNKLTAQASRIFFAKKPVPVMHSNFENGERFQLGSLSHFLKFAALGYEPLLPFAQKEMSISIISSEKDIERHIERSFDEDSDASPSTTTTESTKDTSEDTSEVTDSDISTSESEVVSIFSEKTSLGDGNGKEKCDLDLLVNLEPLDCEISFQNMPSNWVSTKEFELLNRVSGKGLNVTYRFTRTPHLLSPHMVNINLIFTNTTSETINDIKLEKNAAKNSTDIQEFSTIFVLNSNCSISSTLGIDFNDSTQMANFQITCSLGSFQVSIRPTMGELVAPKAVTEDDFTKEKYKLRGMNEHSSKIAMTNDKFDVTAKVLSVANLSVSPTLEKDTFRFSGVTLKSSSLVLVTVLIGGEDVRVTTNCEKFVVGSILLNELMSVFKS